MAWTLADYRADKRFDKFTDEQLLQLEAQHTGRDVTPDFAQGFGYDGPMSAGTAGFTGHFRNAKAGIESLAGAGAQALGFDGAADTLYGWSDAARARTAMQQQLTGTPASLSEIQSLGDAGKFAAYNVGSLLGFGAELASGEGVASLGARALGAVASPVARMAAGAAVTYPQTVGDIVSQQRENGGNVDLTGAVVAGAPAAALNVWTPAGKVANVLGREGARLAEGRAANAGLNALLHGGSASAAMTAQDAIMQGGAMLPNPGREFDFGRSGEAAAMGALLGGAVGGLHGAIQRRTALAEGNPVNLSTEPTDAAAPTKPYAAPGDTLFTNTDDTGGWAPTGSAAHLDIGPALDERGLGWAQRDLFDNALGTNTPIHLATEPAPIQRRIDDNLGVTRTPLKPGSKAHKTAEAEYAALAGEPSGAFALDANGLERPVDMLDRFSGIAGVGAEDKPATTNPSAVAEPPKLSSVWNEVAPNDRKGWKAEMARRLDAAPTPEAAVQVLRAELDKTKSQRQADALNEMHERLTGRPGNDVAPMPVPPVKLSDTQKAVVDALQHGDVVDASGRMSPQLVAEAAGLSDRSVAANALKQTQGKVAKATRATPEEIKAALQRANKLTRDVEGADVERLGLAPDEQVSVLDHQTPLDAQGLSEIGSVGGSVSAVGERAPARTALEAPQDGVAHVMPDNRAYEAVHRVYEEVRGGMGPEWDTLSDKQQQRLIDLYANDPVAPDDMRTGHPFAREVAVLQRADRESQAMKVSRGQEANAIEPRVQALRDKVGPTQTRVLDKMLDRYLKGDIELSRLTDELDRLESEAFDPEAGGKGMRYSKDAVSSGTTREAFTRQLSDLLPDGESRRVRIYDTLDEARAANPHDAELQSSRGSKVQAFVSRGAAHFILENIPAGRERAVFMHEVGAHLGLDKILSPEQFDHLLGKIEHWAERSDGSVESEIAKAAMARVEKAGTPEGDRYSEMLAYFVEEAINRGVDPTAAKHSSELGRWFRQLFTAFQQALQKLGFEADNLTARDVVDLAYGAAHMTLEGEQHGLHEAQVQHQTAPAGPQRGEQDGSRTVAGTPAAAGWREASAVHVRPGEPATVYRGSIDGRTRAADFAEDRLGVASGNPNAALGVWFSSHPEDARRYGAPSDYHLDIRNPLVFETSDVPSFADRDEARAFVEWARSRGHDGVVFDYRDSNGPVHYVAFEPEQVIHAEAKAPTAEGTRVEEASADDFAKYFGEHFDPDGTKYSIAADAPAVRQRVDELHGAGEKLTPLLKALGDAWYNAKEHGKTALDWVSFTHDLAGRASKLLKDAKPYFDTLNEKWQSARQHLEALQRIGDEYATLDTGERKAAQKLIFDSTFSERQWAFKPEWIDHEVPISPKLEAEFKALSPTAQKVVRDVFKRGYDTRVARNEATKTAHREVLESTIAAAKDELKGTKGRIERARLEKDLLRAEKELAGIDARYGKVMEQFDAPYAPIMRFGDYLAVGKSQKFLDAEAAGDADEIAKLKQSADEYHVSFHDTPAAAKNKADELAARDMQTTHGQRLEIGKKLADVDFVTFSRLMKRVEEQASGRGMDRVGREMQNMLQQIYLKSLEDDHIRRSDLAREYVHGADPMQSMRAFFSREVSAAHMLSTLKHHEALSRQMQNMLNEARDTVDAKSADRRRMANHIVKLYEASLTPREGAWDDVQNRLMRLNSVWRLMTTPAYLFMNATQPVMFSVPYMAGRHGYGRSLNTMLRAYSDFWQGTKGDTLLKTMGKIMRGEAYDIKALGDRGEAGVVKRLLDKGLIDINLDSEIGQWLEAGETRMGNAQRQVFRKLAALPHFTELANRVTTALAAYRLERDRLTADNTKLDTKLTSDEIHDRAAKYAEDVIQTTHGDYSAGNAPLLFRKMPKVMMQFRKFQFIQLAMLAKMTKEAFKGESKEARTAARLALGYMVGGFGALAGGLGVPGASKAASIVTSIFGDEEDVDKEQTLRKWIGDPQMADLLLHGLPTMANLNLTNRLGSGDVMDLFPYVNEGKTAKDTFTNYVMAALGPSASLGGQFADGIGNMAQGNYWKGLEKMMPSGARDVLRAVRYAEEGQANKHGDLLLSPEQIGAMGWATQALGLPPMNVTEAQRASNVAYQTESHFKDRTAELRKDYAEAVKNNDTEAQQAARAEWKKMQEAQQRAGLKPSPLSNLLRARTEQLKRERNTIRGVQFRKNDKALVESVTE